MSKYTTIAWFFWATVYFVDSENKPKSDNFEHTKCSLVTHFVTVPILENYYTDVLSIMTGVVTMVPYVYTPNSAGTNNHITDINPPIAKQQITELLANVFNPVTDVDTVHFIHEDTFHSRNISLGRFNGTLVRQRYLPGGCSTEDRTCFLSHDTISSGRSTMGERSELTHNKIQWKLYCDQSDPDVVVSAGLQLHFTAKDVHKESMDNKYSNARR